MITERHRVSISNLREILGNMGSNHIKTLIIRWKSSKGFMLGNVSFIFHISQNTSFLIVFCLLISYMPAAAQTWEFEWPDAPHIFSNFADRFLRLNGNGSPRIAYGGDHLYFAWTNPRSSSWHFETIDFSTAAGSWASLVLDQNEKPHVSYFDYSQESLKYAYLNGSSWQIESIDSPFGGGYRGSLALDCSEKPHICHINIHTNELLYSGNIDDEWQHEFIDDVWSIAPVSMCIDSNEHFHVCYASTYPDHALRYAYRDSGVWHMETVDTLYATGRYTRLAVDGNGRPHIAYVSFLEAKLLYAVRHGTGWHISTVDTGDDYITNISLTLSDTGVPHVSYQDNSILKHAYRDGDVWSWEYVNGGFQLDIQSSISVDDNDCVHIAYYDPYHEQLWHTRRHSTGWSSHLVDSGGRVGNYTCVGHNTFGPCISYHDVENGGLKYAFKAHDEWNVQYVDPSTAGKDGSLVIDRSGFPHISYAKDTGSSTRLWYAFQDDSGWHRQWVENDAYTVVWCTSIDLDYFDHPHIAYYAGMTGIRYARYTGETWMLQTVDPEATSNSRATMALDTQDTPHITYNRYTSGSDISLVHAWYEADGWRIETVDSDGANGTSINFHPAGYPCISYSTDGDLKYASRPGNNWQIETVDDGCYTYRHISLIIDHQGWPHIGYYDLEKEDLKYAYLNETGWHIHTILSQGDVGEYVSLTLDEYGMPCMSFYNKTMGDLGYVQLTGEETNYLNPALCSVDTGERPLYIKPEILVSPNPFSSSLSVSLNTMIEGSAHIAIYDLSGRRIDAFSHDQVLSGPSQLTWTPMNLRPNTYIISLKLDNSTILSKRIVYVP